jgi:hypothetical protein
MKDRAVVSKGKGVSELGDCCCVTSGVLSVSAQSWAPM